MRCTPVTEADNDACVMQGALRAAAESGLGGAQMSESSSSVDREQGMRLRQQVSEGTPLSEGTPAVRCPAVLPYLLCNNNNYYSEN